MLNKRFQFRLRHLFAATAFFSLVCWFLIVVILPVAALGSRHDLPLVEKKLLASLRADGLSICDEFR